MNNWLMKIKKQVWKENKEGLLCVHVFMCQFHIFMIEVKGWSPLAKWTQNMAIMMDRIAIFV